MRFLSALIAFLLALGTLGARSAGATMPGRVGRIAFDNLSSITTVLPDGTGRRRLTSGGNLDWSPDGTKIAYDAGGAVWVANANGTGARRVLTGANSPSWSREGERLAVVTAQGIRVIRVSDGATLAELGPGRFPAWSPVDDRIAYASPQQYQCDFGSGVDTYNTERLTTTKADGTGTSYLTDDTCQVIGGAYHPDWSPDGTRIVFQGYQRVGQYTRSGDVFVISSSGGAPTNLTLGWTYNPPTGFEDRGFDPFEGFPSWSPDGTMIAFAAAVDSFQTRSIHDLWVMDPSGGGARRLANGGDRAYNVDWGSAADGTASFTWEPTGERVVRFDASASTGAITRYQWSFGDQSPLAETVAPTIDHEYAAPGTYTVKLTILDAAGPLDATTREVTIEAGELTLDVTAETPQPQGVKSGDRIDFRLAVDGSSAVATVVVRATVRLDLVDVDPASITAGGVLTGDTVTWNLDGAALPTVLGLAATVRGQDEIPDTILFIGLTADADATLDDGGALHAEDGVLLTYLRTAVDVAIATVTRRTGRALPGEEVRYQVTVTVREDTETLTVEAALPAGTKLVPGSITQGGAKKGTRIRWTFAGTGTPPVLEYRVAVPPEKKLKALTQLESDATAEAVLARGDTVTGSATHVLPILLLVVQGTITDAVMTFPNANVVNTSRPLGGATVRLLRGSDVVAETVSDRKGVYRLGADDEGTFTLEVRKKADQYSHLSNSITTEARDVVQRREITLAVPQPEPLTKDVILPIGVVNRAAQTLRQLNDFPVPLFSGAITTELIKMYYDTAGAEDWIESVIGAAPEFPGVFAGSGPRDEWNGMIRAVAFWAVAATRVQDAITLADDAGKTLALLVTVEVLKKLGQNKLISPTGDSIPQLSRQRLKIGVMVTFVGAALPLVLDGLGIQGQQKAQIIQIVATLLRFGADKWTGQFTDDLVFEIIFDVLRSAVVVVTMGEIFGASSNATSLLPDGPILGRRGVQSLIDDVVAAAQVRRYAGDTLQVLTAVNNQNDALEQSFNNVHFAATSSLSVFGVFRGVKGIFEKGDKIEFKSGKPYTGTAKKAQALLGKLAKPVQVLSLVAAAEGIAHPFYEIAEVQLPGTEAMANTAFEVPVRAAARLGDVPVTAAPAASGARVTLLGDARLLAEAGRTTGVRAARAKAPPAGPAVAAYLDVSARLGKALKKKDPAVVAALRQEQAAADAAVFGAYLEPLAHEAQAALPAIGDPGLAAELLAFLDAVVLASTRCGLYYVQLDLWELAPGEASTSAIAKDAKLCATALLAADAAAARAAATTGGVATSGRLVITGGDLPPAVLRAGQRFTVEFTVTNVGDAGLPAGTATLATPGGHLEVDGSASQALPALAAGASTTLAWSLTTAPSAAAYLAAYQLEVRADGADPALFTDFTLVQP